jgi:hypothetical protein
MKTLDEGDTYLFEDVHGNRVQGWLPYTLEIAKMGAPFAPIDTTKGCNPAPIGLPVAMNAGWNCEIHGTRLIWESKHG